MVCWCRCFGSLTSRFLVSLLLAFKQHQWSGSGCRCVLYRFDDGVPATSPFPWRSLNWVVKGVRFDWWRRLAPRGLLDSLALFEAC